MRSRFAFVGATIVFLATCQICAADTVPPGTDDSVWINKAITDAIAQGKSEYDLPAGNYYLENPVVIPAGTQNFTFKGAGSTQTFFKTPNAVIKQAIQVGVNPVLSDNWWITGSNNVPINSVVTGQTKIKLVTPSASFKTGYYILWDEYKIICAKGPNVSMNHAEVVNVTAYDQSTGTATIDVPAGREYTQNPKMAPYQGAVCHHVTVQGFGFDGLSSAGDSEGLAMVGISDGVVLRDLSVLNFRSDSIMTNTARNVLIDHVNVSTTSNGDAGSGYGVAIYRSRFVTIQNSTAQACRHGFILHSGAMDVTLNNCSTTNGFDTHGYDERRITFLNCTGDGGDIGNDAWLGGAQSVTIRNCTFTEPFGFHANVRNVRIADSTMGGVMVYSAEPGTTPTVGVPAGGLADSILFERCTFKGTGYTMFWETGATRMGTLTFSNCSWENTSPDWGSVLQLATISGTLNFLDCNMKVDSTDHVVQLTDPNPKLSVTMRRCKLSGKGGLGVWISSAFGGKGTFLSNNYLALGAATSTFLCDDTHKQVSSGNTSAKQ